MARSREDTFAQIIIGELEPLNDRLPSELRKDVLFLDFRPDEVERLSKAEKRARRHLVIGRAESIIRSELKELKELASNAKRGNAPQRETKDAAQRLKKPLAELMKVLSSIPADNLFSTRARSLDLPAILSEFQRLREVVERSLPHGLVDVTKAHCASAAWRLIFGLSENKPSTTRVRTIANHLIEFLTGKPDTNEGMKRACETCVRQMRSQERELERERATIRQSLISHANSVLRTKMRG